VCDKGRMKTTNTTTTRVLKPEEEMREVRRIVQKMLDEGRSADAVETLLRLIEAIREENKRLSVQIALFAKQMYGRRSEKKDPNQLALFEEESSEGSEEGDGEVEATSAEGSKASERGGKRGSGNGHGRAVIPSHIPRVEVIHEPKEKVCKECESEKHVIGYEVSEELEWVEGHFVVRRHKRKKVACRRCQGGVEVAEVPVQVIERGKPGPGLLTHILVAKYQDSLPLSRLSEIYERAGVEIPTSTLSDWVGRATDMLRPIYDELVEEAKGAYVLGVDDTGLRVLRKGKGGGSKMGYMWAYVADGKIVVFDFTADHKSSGPAKMLEGRQGYVQCDGYKGYAKIARDNPGIVWVGCMAHARRKFVEALDAGDGRAAYAVMLFQKLYEVEKEAREKGKGPEELLKMRQERSAKVMEELHGWLVEMKPRMRKDYLGRAVRYTLEHWETLTVYLKDGRVPIDNNAVERELRRVAVGRKNYLFAGSEAGGHRAAVMYSILATCWHARVNPSEYLRDVLWKLAEGWKAKRIEELTPHAWAKAHATGPPG